MHETSDLEILMLHLHQNSVLMYALKSVFQKFDCKIVALCKLIGR